MLQLLSGAAAAERLHIAPGVGVIEQALSAARQNDVLLLQAGKYELLEPLLVQQAGIELRGAGADETILQPRFAAEAVVHVDAPDVVIASLGIDGRQSGGPGRAAFGILIGNGVSGCRFQDIRVAHTQATSILGKAVSNCAIERSTVLDSGSDAIQLRGGNLTIRDNVLVDYFDEAIDLGAGNDVHVLNNFMASGRIGFTLFDSASMSAINNTVVDQALGGMHLSCAADCRASGNVFKDVGTSYGLRISGPFVANDNKLDSTMGIVIENSNAGRYENNQIHGAEIGFQIRGSTDVILANNHWCGPVEAAIQVDASSTMAASAAHPDCREVDDAGITASDPETAMPVVAVEGSGTRELPTVVLRKDDPRSREVADSVLHEFSWKNVGVQTLEIVQPGLMISEIDANLHDTLRRHGELAIGTVRSPYRAYQSADRAVLPRWILTTNNVEVAVVTWHRAGANVIVRMLDDGQLSLGDKIDSSLNWASRRLNKSPLRRITAGHEVAWLTGALIMVLIAALASIAWLLRTSRKRAIRST